jgi:hypothetical protein
MKSALLTKETDFDEGLDPNEITANVARIHDDYKRHYVLSFDFFTIQKEKAPKDT